MEFKKIFVTVGTTEFPELIERLSSQEVARILKDHFKCKELKVQYGRGVEMNLDTIQGIAVKQFSLKQDIKTDIQEADLIISHAGAGTCIDVLSLQKPLVVVINDTLMNNHQVELAEQLAKDGYLFYTNIEGLPGTLQAIDTSKLKEYEPGNVDLFINHLNKFMGFA